MLNVSATPVTDEIAEQHFGVERLRMRIVERSSRFAGFVFPRVDTCATTRSCGSGEEVA